MSKDLLLEVSQNKIIKDALSSIGIPVPFHLKRKAILGESLALRDKNYIVCGNSHYAKHIAVSIFSKGGNIYLENWDNKTYLEAAEGYSRKLGSFSDIKEEFKANGIIYDAGDISKLSDLNHFYSIVQPIISRLSSGGRFVILTRPEKESSSPEESAVLHSLEGFIRSLSKEIGKKGATSHIVYIGKSAEDRIEGMLQFLLSDSSSFLTGQAFHLNTLAKKPSQIPKTRFLESKIALVTGSARGIGEATVRALAREGATVICVDRPEESSALAKTASSIGGKMLALDISEKESPDKICEYIRTNFGKLDILVHNAGITRDRTFGKMSRDIWEKVLLVNLESVILITNNLISNNMISDYGRIACLSSISGIAGNLGQTNYATSKAGIIGYVRKLSVELAAKGITVNAVAPGFIETKMTEAIPALIKEVGRRLSSLAQGGQPEDVAETITFLSSPLSSGLTGQVIRVCGGNFLGA